MFIENKIVVVFLWIFSLITMSVKSTFAEGEWKVVHTLETGQSLNAIFFLDLQNGYAVGTEGIILKTDDGGDNWFLQTSGTDNNLSSVNFGSQTNGWVVGDNGTILQTEDGGDSWQAIESATSDHLHDVYFLDENRGWIVGGTSTVRFSMSSGFSNLRHSNVILTSNDGGTSWSQITNQGNKRILKSIHFADSLHGFAVGYGYYLNGPWDIVDRNIIIITNDGGVTWSSKYSEVNDHLYDLYAIDQNNIWIVGDNGILLNSTNGGEDWYQQSINASTSLSGIYFPSSSIGWIVGAGGLIYHTNDGGNSFTVQEIDIYNSLNSVYFIDEKNGWAVGSEEFLASGGVILKYTEDLNTSLSNIDSNHFPRDITLMQNFPNPFNPTTHIRFGLPEACYVKIELYNIVGQKICTLFEGYKNAGYHTIEFNGSNLAGGLYLYRMQSTNFNKVKKMLLAK